MAVILDFDGGFQFDHWQVYPDSNSLKSAQDSIAIEPKMMAVLVFLAKHQGEIIGRDTLMENVWNGRVVSDEVLSRIVSLLRTALNDSSRNPRYIKTVPKKGYVFLAKVSELATEDVEIALTTPPQKKLTVTSLAVLSSFGLLAVVFASLYLYEPTEPIETDNLIETESTKTIALNNPNSKVSIAILPFQRETGDIFQQFLSDGLFDELVTVLPIISDLRVVSRKQSFGQLDGEEPVSRLIALNDIDLVLDGSISEKSDLFVFNLQLLSLKTGGVVWSAEHKSNQTNQYDMQRGVVELITNAIQDYLGLEERSIATKNTPDPDAYQLYIRGRQQFKLRGEKPLRESIKLLSEAIHLDPSFQKSYISLAEAYSVLPFYSAMPAREGYTLALTTLGKLNSKNDILRADASAIRAQIATRQWKWAEAEKLFQESFSLSKQNANTYMWYSEFLSATGQLLASSEAARYSKELDGISAVVNNRLAVTYLWLNDDERAEKYFGHGFEFGFINYTNPGYAIFLLRKKAFLEAKKTLTLILESNGVSADWVERVVDGIDDHAKRKLAAKTFETAINNRQVPARFQPPIWIFLQEYQKAANSFDVLIQNKYDIDIEFLFSNEATEFRSTEEFERLTRIIGLQNYWQRKLIFDYTNSQNAPE